MPTGRCLCGELRYEYAGEPAMKAICHCITCRRLTGSTFSTNIVVAEGKYKVTSGTPKTHTTIQDSGMRLTHSFCSNCGITISKVADGEAFKGLVMIQAGSLDDDNGLNGAAPEVELYGSRRVPWLSALEGVSQKWEFA